MTIYPDMKIKPGQKIHVDDVKYGRSEDYGTEFAVVTDHTAKSNYKTYSKRITDKLRANPDVVGHTIEVVEVDRRIDKEGKETVYMDIRQVD